MSIFKLVLFLLEEIGGLWIFHTNGSDWSSVFCDMLFKQSWEGLQLLFCS